MAKNPKFVILLYHKIGRYPSNAKFPGLYVAESDFDEQIKYLKYSGFTFLTLTELKAVYDFYYVDGDGGAGGGGGAARVAPALINPRGKYAAITFDDGSMSVYGGGFPVLKDNGVKATVFMVSGLVGGVNDWDVKNGENPDEMLGEAELKEMAEYGVEIGAHTRTHPHLTAISAGEALDEIGSSKKDLEELTGGKINFFAYPYGDYNEETERLAEKAGFMGACVTKTGIVKKGADFFALRRVAIRHNTGLFKFKRKIFKVRLFY